MKRTGLSIAGGIILLLASIGMGIGGIGFSIAGNAESMMALAKKQIEAAEKNGNLTPQQQQQMEDAKAKMAQAEAELKDPEKREKLEKLKSYGYFEVFAALVGVIGGIGLLLAGGFGKVSGMIAAVLGAASCAWGLAIGTGAPVQIVFLILFGIAFAGAFSLKEDRPVAV
jgi:hypothetical protein